MGVKRALEDSDSISDNERVSISEDQAALYDRQIRLWGLDSQKRLMDANILIIGMNGLATEIVKNICLSGVRSITLMDETLVKESDFAVNFFIAGCEPGEKTRAEASKNAVQDLNPNVIVKVEKDTIANKEADFFRSFALVFATDLPLSNLVTVNEICNSENILFFSGDTFGLYGYCFLDLLHHKYKVQNESEMVLTEKQYQSLEKVFDGLEVGNGLTRKTNSVFYLVVAMYKFLEKNKRLHTPDDFPEMEELLVSTLEGYKAKSDKLHDMFKFSFGELNPVCAVMGGIIANEIVKALTACGHVIHNFLFFDGNICSGVVESIGERTSQKSDPTDIHISDIED